MLTQLTLNQLIDYSIDAQYWKMEEMGIDCKRPMTENEVEEQKERDAAQKALYNKLRNKAKLGKIKKCNKD